MRCYSSGSHALVLTLWFSAAAVAPQLCLAWDLSIVATTSLTLAVQVGFVVGAFTIAASGIAERMAASEQRKGDCVDPADGAGFLPTIVTIRGVPMVAEAFGWQWAFPWLAIGPALGIVAMTKLRSSKNVQLAT